MKKTALVVPSIREDSFNRFLNEWRPHGLFEQVDLILIEDNPTKTFALPDWLMQGSGRFRHRHFCWEDIDAHLGKDSWIIPRRSDTVRSFGYWWVWAQRGLAHDAYCPTYEYLMTLDDDCYPEPGYERLQDIHESLLERTKWFNTLNNVRPRGTPYGNLGRREVYVNHGLWTNVLDYDAPQQLVNPVKEVFTHDNRMIPHGSYFSFCGMNWMCRREAIPLMYHLLMGKRKLGTEAEVKKGITDAGGCPSECPDFDVNSSLLKLPFDRFGDIWCGLLMKKICDHLGWAVASGVPYVHHDRASNPFANLRKEANGIEVNEWLWQKIDEIKLPIIDSEDPDGTIYRWADPIDCYRQLALGIDQLGGEHAGYWADLSEAMLTWCDLFVEPKDEDL